MQEQPENIMPPAALRWHKNLGQKGERIPIATQDLIKWSLGHAPPVQKNSQKSVHFLDVLHRHTHAQIHRDAQTATKR